MGYPSLKLNIAGEWLGAEGRETFDVRNPASEAVLGALPLAGASDLDRALEAANEGFALWRKSPPEQRAAVLSGAARLMRERLDDIARLATLEEGKTFEEARGETLGSAAMFDFYAGECFRIYGRVLVRPAGMRSLVMKEPIGPVAAFAPWNFPVGNPARKLGAPIAAGCSVILKPAEEAPASAMAVLQALLDAGLPKGVAQLVFGVPDTVSRHLLASEVTRKLSFTGSVAVGKHLMRLAADTVMKCTLELGGHAPVIIFDDCDVEKAVDTLVTTKSRNSGQVCVSPTRFQIQEGIYDRFVAKFVERFKALKVGDGLDPATNMGPMANPRRPEAIESLVADATKRGAQVLCGGERMDGDGYYYQPTVVAELGKDARLMQEEPFGPIALMTRFKTLDEAITEANRLPYGLASFIFTENARTANLASSGIEAGMVGINTAMLGAADAPFGGVKFSGYGSESGPEGVEACLVTKAIHQV